MQKWEYKSLIIDLHSEPANATKDLLAYHIQILPDGTKEGRAWYHSALEEELNKLGQEGWELVAATPEIMFGTDSAGCFLFKRPIVSEGACRKIIVQIPTPDTPIQEIPFSTRAANGLLRNGVDTLAQLLVLTEEDVMQMRYIGYGALSNISSVLNSYGLSLRSINKLPLGTQEKE